MSYITRKQAAERLSVSVRVLDGLIARGQLPAYKIGSKLVRISEADLERYMKRQIMTPASLKTAPADRPCLYVPGMKVV